MKKKKDKKANKNLRKKCEIETNEWKIRRNRRIKESADEKWKSVE